MVPSDTDSTRDAAKVMNRGALTKRLVAKLKNEEAVIGGVGNNNFDLWAAGQRPQNFYMLGSMGLAGSIALGVAITQPRRKIFALEGDGSILMQLGSFGTMATVAPDNLCLIIWDNSLYQITGSQKTLTATGTDLVAMARGAGITQADWAADEDHFDVLVDAALTEKGPRVIAVRTDNATPVVQTDRDPARIRMNFMRGIGASA